MESVGWAEEMEAEDEVSLNSVGADLWWRVASFAEQVSKYVPSTPLEVVYNQQIAMQHSNALFWDKAINQCSRAMHRFVIFRLHVTTELFSNSIELLILFCLHYSCILSLYF